tara:strand:+ start:581 stop:865 length:285 start_codon:yes stop_codon:yes gene_type:complete
MLKKELCCGKCKAKGVRLYRWYSFMFTESDVRCNGCIEPDEFSGMVPCCKDEDGTVWGYMSTPKELVDEFYKLPENNKNEPTWLKYGFDYTIQK